MNFESLWNAYPEEYYPCSDELGNPNFENQCAIRMGVCLSAVGFPMNEYDGARCWHHRKSFNHSLRVEELCKFLKKKLKNHDLITCVKSGHNLPNPKDFDGESGIVAFINFWGSGNQGDHIDLWSGSELKTGELDYFERSEKVMFWRIA